MSGAEFDRTASRFHSTSIEWDPNATSYESIRGTVIVRDATTEGMTPGPAVIGFVSTITILVVARIAYWLLTRDLE